MGDQKSPSEVMRLDAVGISSTKENDKVKTFKVVALVALIALVTPMVALAKNGSGPGSSAGGGNNGNGGGASHGGGQGGGDGGHGGGNNGGGNGGGNGGNGGGNGGGNNGGGGEGGHGGGYGGGSSSSIGVSDGGSSPSSSGGPTGFGSGSGISQASREKLMDAVRTCEAVRPGLALGDTTANGGWSFRTHDDTVWPFVQRCMKSQGYPANGIDYSDTSNFGSR